MTTALPFFLLVPLLTGALPAAAQDGSHGSPRDRGVERFDADGDHRLSDQERDAARTAVRGRIVELDRRAGDIRARIRDRLGDAPDLGARVRSKLDHDGDGRIDRFERRAARDWIRERVRAPRVDRACPHEHSRGGFFGGSKDGAGDRWRAPRGRGLR